MTVVSLRTVAVLLLAGLTASLAAAGAPAGAPWDGPPFSASPAAILEAASKIPAKEDEGVVILLDEARYVFDATGRMQRTEYLVYRVASEGAAEDWSSIEVPWSPWYSDKPVVDARVITKDGNVHRLDPKSFGTEDAPDDPSMFTDVRTLEGPLPAVAEGSVVEQTIVWHEKNPIEGAGVTDRHQFGRWVGTQHSRVVIEYPSTLTVRIANHTSPAIEPVRTEVNGLVHIVYETGPLPAFEAMEWNLPPDEFARSFISLSTGRSWNELARKYEELVDKQIGSEPLGRAVPPLGNAKTAREIAALFLARVEHGIRYAGVEFGEGSIIPRTPQETLAHKYGDCKDKATLLVAMLRQAGVEAHTALLVAGQGPDVEPELPGLGQFNHVIVAVGSGSDLFWVDPTDEYARAGELPMQDQGRRALIASRDTTELTVTPVAEPSWNVTSDTREFFLAEIGKSRVSEVTEYRGQWERNMRREYAEASGESIKKGLESYVTDGYAAKSLGKYSTSDPHDLTTPFTVRVEALESTRGITAGGEAAVGVFLAHLLSDVPGDLHPREKEEEQKPPRKARTRDYVFFNPHVRDMSYIIHPPAGYVLRTPAMNETVKLGTMTVTKELSAGADGVIKARFHFETGPRRITAAQFEETRAAIGKFETEPALLITLDQVGQKYLDSGDIAKALGEFRHWTTAHPKEASHHIDMARTLLAAGFGDEARREARKAVEIEPKSSAAHAILAKTLIHDAVGRELKKGADVPQAILEYRKAKELDPSNSMIRAELASVLAYNDAGRKYGKGARLAEAIAEYEAMKKDVECNADAVDRALMALFLRTNEWSRLEELTKKTTDTEMKDAHRLVAIAMQNGAPAAIEAARSIDATKRRNALAQAGSLVAMERNYAVAADLVEAAAQGAPNAAALRQQITILRKSKPIDTLEADPSDPTTALLQMLMGTRTLKMREAMTKLLSAEAFATFDEEEKEEDDPDRDEEFMTFSIDVAIAAIDIQKDGDDKAGYRLRGRIAAQNTDMTVFVVPEKNEWKIAAISTTPPMLALRALRLVESENLEGARKWLDWARDLIDGSDQDPVATSPFAAVWTRGKAADETTTRTAAALLLPFTKQSAEIALPVLLSARPDAAPDVQWRIDQALGVAYGLLEKWPELLETADRLADRHPDSATAFEWGYRALYQLKRFEEIEKRANARLARLADDPAALRSLGRLALERGQPAVAQKYFAEVIAKATTPSATDYNEQAWSALFSGSSIPDAIEQARQAVAIAPRHYASLNTLAALYAEQNSSAEARETFLQSLAAGTDEMETQDWYIVGRIAENYGMREPAIEAYRKVEKPKSIEGSSWQLAQKRLEGLAPAKRK